MTILPAQKVRWKPSAQSWEYNCNGRSCGCTCKGVSKQFIASHRMEEREVVSIMARERRQLPRRMSKVGELEVLSSHHFNYSPKQSR